MSKVGLTRRKSPICPDSGRNFRTPESSIVIAADTGRVAEKRKGEYCLNNHIKCENLSDVPVDPEPRKQRHGQVHKAMQLLHPTL
jgi:hypothetical protein